MKAFKIHSTLVLIAVLTLISGCETTRPPMQSGLQQQAYQTKEFPVSKRVSFNATLSVLSDFGYIIESADYETGFITGTAPTMSRFDAWWGPMNEGGKATAFITDTSVDSSRVRLTFVTTSQRKSALAPSQDVIKEIPVSDPVVYNNVFDKIDETIFISTSTNK